jgi:hypothetical protein
VRFVIQHKGGGFFYRRGPAPHWTTAIGQATRFTMSKLAWDEIHDWKLDGTVIMLSEAA